MISWLKGRVLQIDSPDIILDCNGVGYQVTIGKNTLLNKAISCDEIFEAAIYTVVREDALSLYGFDSFHVRKLFSLLLSVNGVGPKQSMNIVDHMNMDLICSSIKSGNASAFTVVPGVGKKIAQRIILDLQGKLEQLNISYINGDQVSVPAEELNYLAKNVICNDAKSALQNLGFSEKETDKIIARHWQEKITLPELLRFCLTDLQRQ